MSNDSFAETLAPVLSDYIRLVREELREHWKGWPVDMAEKRVHEVVGALIARQVSLVTRLVQSPGIWNPHVGPLVLRVMVDNHINLAWMLAQPEDRTRKFVEHGLGQEKLILERRKNSIREVGGDPEVDEGIKTDEAWIDSQKFGFLTEVNIGGWAGLDTRKMAEEVGLLDMHRHDYTTLSCAVHNMWNHVGRYNVEKCLNPLHGFHFVPCDSTQYELDVNYPLGAASYMEGSFELLRDKTGVTSSVPSAFVYFEQALSKLEDEGATEGARGEPDSTEDDETL
jgi:hypothetical protein